MPRNDVVAIAELGDRVQEHGRIRLGVKTPNAMKAIDTFRFTSPDELAITKLAELYGGKARAWSEPKANPPDQFEVITAAKSIRIFLPPGGLSCWYEMWSGGGCVRRCDGLSCAITRSGGPDAGMVDVPCLCGEEKIMRCKPYTRLQVILPELHFAGVWRLETKGWTAAHEMPAMEALIASIQGRGVIEARLVVEKAQAEGGRHKFIVPRIQLADTALALAAGNVEVRALHGGAVAELGPGGGESEDEDEPEWFDADDVVVDGELVDESEPGADAGLDPLAGAPGVGGHERGDNTGDRVPVPPPSAPKNAGHEDPAPRTGQGGAPPSAVQDPPPGADGAPPAPRAARTGALSKAERLVMVKTNEAGAFVSIEPDFLRHALCRKASQGATATTRELTADEISTVIVWCDELLAETSTARVTRRDPPTIKLTERTLSNG